MTRESLGCFSAGRQAKPLARNAGRVFEDGYGAHPRAAQSRMFAAEERLGRPLTQAEGQSILRETQLSLLGKENP